jgi:ApaG protein
LDLAVKEERYKDAAKLKEQMKALEAELGPAVLFSGHLSTQSDTTTHGIRVEVQSSFVPLQSYVPGDRYFFAYSIKITNNSDKIVQLRHRHWIIMDANGKVEEVR